MADWSLLGAQRYSSFAHNAATSRGVDVTSNATINVKSASWIELDASTDMAAHGIIVQLDLMSGGRDALVDIAIGGAGSEVVIAANLYVGSGTGGTGYGATYVLPISIPEGTRLSAKSQSTTASTVVPVQVIGYQTGLSPSSPSALVDTYGADTTDSGGTSFDPGATINTKAATWTQIVATTSRRHNALLLAVGNQLNLVRTSANWLVDIGVGASSAEQTLIPNIQIGANTSSDTMLPQVLGPFPVHIPAGTRLSVRSQCSIADATDRLADLIIYGVC